MKQIVRRCLAHPTAKVPIGVLAGTENADIFQRAGIHITGDHFYQPIPNVNYINLSLWDNQLAMPGIDRNFDEQLAFFQTVCALGLRE